MGKANPLDAFTPAELRKLRSLKTPYGIQKYIDDMPYHLADTGWSPRKVLKEKTSHCFEGAMLAAAALRAIGHPPLIFDLEAEHDTDHVVAIYKIKDHWGSIAKSNYTGCRYREPVYRTLRELAMSYFDTYFNLRRERTLRRFSVPVHMKRFDHLDWMTTGKSYGSSPNTSSTSATFLLFQKRRLGTFTGWTIAHFEQAALGGQKRRISNTRSQRPLFFGAFPLEIAAIVRQATNGGYVVLRRRAAPIQA